MIESLTTDVSGLGKEFDNLYKSAGIDAEKAARSSQDFIDTYAIVGSADTCVDRLRQISELGISKVIAVGFAETASSNNGRFATETFLNQIAPALKN